MKSFAKTLIISAIVLSVCGGDDYEGFRPDDALLFRFDFRHSSLFYPGKLCGGN